MRSLLALLSILGLYGSYQAGAEESALSKLKASADLRFRHEFTSKKGSGDTHGNHKERVRVSTALSGDVNERIFAKIQLGTADSASPTSNNSTFTSNSSKKGIYLDLAYVDWKFCDCDESQLKLTLGKQYNPYRLTWGSQILYDSDYTPEGATIYYDRDFFIHAGAYSIEDRTASSTTNPPDSSLMAGVAGYKGNLGAAKYMAAIGYHDFTNLKGQSALSSSFNGNSNSSSLYIHEYKIGDFQLVISHPIGDWSLEAFANGVQNFGTNKNNLGLSTGLIAKQKADLPWAGGYMYQVVGKDATLGAISDSDYANGNVGALGHMFSLSKGIAANTNVAIRWYHSKVDNDGAPYWTNKGLFDIEFKL